MLGNGTDVNRLVDRPETETVGGLLWRRRSWVVRACGLGLLTRVNK